MNISWFVNDSVNYLYNSKYNKNARLIKSGVHFII